MIKVFSFCFREYARLNLLILFFTSMFSTGAIKINILIIIFETYNEIKT